MNRIVSPEQPSREKPWLKYYPPNSRNQSLPYRTIYDEFCEGCGKHPKAKALYYYGTSVMYRALRKRIDDLADAFYGIGVREGEMVSFLMPTTPESICCLYALSKIGATPNFIDPRMDPERILHAVSGAKSKLFVTMDFAFPKVQAIRDRLEVERIVVSSVSTTLPSPMKLLWHLKKGVVRIPYGGDVLRWKTFLAFGKNVSAPKAAFRENSVAAITYTGGTTGTPKGGSAHERRT